MSVLTGEVVGGELQLALRRTWLHLGLGVGQVPGLARRRPEAEAATCKHTRIRRRFRGDGQFRATRRNEVCGRTLSRGEIGRSGVEVSCDRTRCSFSLMAVWRYGGTSLTHLAVHGPSPGRLGSLLLGASRSTSLPCAPLPFAFLAQPDDDGRLSRNFLISREKTPPHKLDISIRKCSWPRQGRP